MPLALFDYSLWLECAIFALLVVGASVGSRHALVRWPVSISGIISVALAFCIPYVFYQPRAWNEFDFLGLFGSTGGQGVVVALPLAIGTGAGMFLLRRGNGPLIAPTAACGRASRRSIVTRDLFTVTLAMAVPLGLVVAVSPYPAWTLDLFRSVALELSSPTSLAARTWIWGTTLAVVAIGTTTLALSVQRTLRQWVTVGSGVLGAGMVLVVFDYAAIARMPPAQGVPISELVPVSRLVVDQIITTMSMCVLMLPGLFAIRECGRREGQPGMRT